MKKGNKKHREFIGTMQNEILVKNDGMGNTEAVNKNSQIQQGMMSGALK